MRILVRADSGFARDWLMAWCEAHGVDFVVGLARNDRLAAEIEWHIERARAESQQAGAVAVSWPRPNGRGRSQPTLHRHLAQPGRGRGPSSLREDRLRANRIKECQIDMFADRTSAATMRANQLRLWLSSMAYSCSVHCAASG